MKKHLALLLLALSTAASAQVATVGMDLFSIHDEPGFNGVNPGVYVVMKSGATAGVLRNSESRTSFYAGETVQVAPHLDIVIGAITGYTSHPVVPFLIPSVKMGPVRMSFLIAKPFGYGADAIHFSIEKDL